MTFSDEALMRLACPACAATYDLPETLFLTGPRKVRCVKCAHSWMAGERVAEAVPAAAPAEQATAIAPGAMTAADPAGAAAETAELSARRSPLRRRPASVIEPVPPAPDLSVLPPPAARSGRGVAAAWALSLALIGGACWGGWEYRSEVMATWPASAHLYAALGGQ